VDGSSKFGKANKYAFFPSAAVAWRLSEEGFMQSLGFFDDLKLRASYGLIGNTPDQSFISIPTLDKSTYNFGGSLVNGFRATRLANENLKWERTASLDIGLDASILNNRVQLTVDYYYKETTDLLLDVQIPSVTGFVTSFQNVGSLKNNGIDIGITTTNINKANFNWQTTLNLSHNRNEVLELSGEDEIFVARSTNGRGQQPAGILRVGEAVGSYYGLVSDGIWNSQQEIDEAGVTSTIRIEPGAERYKDINGDNIIDGEDRIILGNDTPDLFGGIINRLSFKNWNLNIFFDGTFGNEVFNFNDALYAAPTGERNQYDEIANRWSESNPNSNIPGASIGAGSLEPRSRWIKDGSYLRLRDLTLAYNIPSEDISWLNSLQIYVSGTNLLRIDNYNGYDPYVSGYGQDNLRRATDLGGYPSSKMYRIGVKLDL
jgi:TonB-linked SusC/RagA family outer membrane protein